MNRYRILNIQQVLQSEDRFISENSQEKILQIAGMAIANYIIKKFKKKKYFLFVVQVIMVSMEWLPQIS